MALRTAKTFKESKHLNQKCYGSFIIARNTNVRILSNANTQVTRDHPSPPNTSSLTVPWYLFRISPSCNSLQLSPPEATATHSLHVLGMAGRVQVLGHKRRKKGEESKKSKGGGNRQKKQTHFRFQLNVTPTPTRKNANRADLKKQMRWSIFFGNRNRSSPELNGAVGCIRVGLNRKEIETSYSNASIK